MNNSISAIILRIKTDFAIVIRFWSVWFGAASTAFLAWLSAFPDQAYTVWSALPGDVTSFVPQKYLPIIGVTLWGMGFISRFIKQRSVDLARAKAAADAAATDTSGKA